MKRFGFIYNPKSNRGRSASTYQALQKIAEDFDDSPIYRVEEQDSIRELTEEILTDVDVVVACGGDGTVQKVVSGLLFTEKTLGIIPLGNGNDLIKSLNIPSGISAASELLKNGDSKPLDVGQCNDSVFVNTLGFGFDGLTNIYAAQIEGVFSSIRYIIAALRANVRHAPFKVTITHEGKSVEKELIMITPANGKVEGGVFWVAPDASVRDGFLDLVMIEPVNKFKLPFLLPLFSLKKPCLIDAYNIQKIDSCLLEFEHPVAVHIDGEIARSTDTSFHISVIPQAVDVICG